MKLTVIRTKHDPSKTYEQFVKERMQGIGGSDVGDMLDAEPYGCSRRLVFDKIGAIPPKDLSFHLERGRFLETPVAELYAARTGRTLKLVGTGYIKEYPFIRANADRLIMGEKVGVLEIKCPAAWSFRKIKKEGLPEAYILQLQWQMLCYGVSWGSFAVYWPDGHELLWFDVERDEELCERLRIEAAQDWSNIENCRYLQGNKPITSMGDVNFVLLDGHPPESTQCRNCQAFDLCHPGKERGEGKIDLPELASIAEAYVSLSHELKQIEREKDEVKDMLRRALADGSASEATAGRYSVSLRTQSRESVSAKVKEILTEEQIVSYVKHTEFDVLTVKEKKSV